MKKEIGKNYLGKAPRDFHFKADVLKFPEINIFLATSFKIDSKDQHVMTRGNRHRGVNLHPRDKGLATLIPVVLHGGASVVKLARRAAP